jgi:hypothetical protein
MTPEERANAIMANLSLVSVTTPRWNAQYEMVEHQIREATAAAYEDAARIADDRAQHFNKLRDPGMANHCRSLAAAIRARAKAG